MSLRWTDLAARFADFGRLPPGTLDGDVRDALAGRRVVVAGASGFVGSWLLAAFAWLNERAPRAIAVTGVSRSAIPIDAPWFTSVAADLRSAPHPPAADFVVHAAMSSEAAPPGGDAEIRDTARAGARWTIAAARAGARALVLSSGAAADATDAYGAAKRDLEREVVAAAQDGAPIAIARLFTCIGPGYRAHRHLAHVALFDAAARGGPLQLDSDGSAVRSYLYGADVAAWLIRGLLLAAPGEVFDVGSPEPVTVRALASRIAKAAGMPESSVRAAATPGSVRPRYVPAQGDAQRRMALAAWTPLDLAIARTIALWTDPAS